MTACTKQSQFIETVDLTEDLYIVETDTVTPSFLTYRLDSFQTSATGYAFIGTVHDPYFGMISSTSYGQFSLAANYYETVGFATESFDSIVLVMHSDHRYYGDTNSLWSVKVHQLKEAVDGDNTIYYNNHSLLAETDNIGGVSVHFRPNVDDTVRIRLSDDFGSGIFQLYKNKDEHIKDASAFHQLYRGLRVSPDADNGVIYSFGSSDSTMYMRLYYHEDQGQPVHKFIDFKSAGGKFQFNNISYDPSGTLLEKLKEGEEILADSLGNQFFVNDMAGIATKITFPSIPSLALQENYIRIAAASLILKPVAGSFDRYPLINYISLGVSNENSGVVAPLYSNDGTFVQTGDLNIDLLNGAATGYSYDLTALARQEIISTAYTTNTVFLQPYNQSGARTISLNRLVGADRNYSKNPSLLNCQLLFYKTK